MAKNEIESFVLDAISEIDDVVRDSVIDVCELINRTQVTYRISKVSYTGLVPVDTSKFINSFEVVINGNIVSPINYVADGEYTQHIERDFKSIFAGLKGGDTVLATFNTDYNDYIEFGRADIPGRYVIQGAVEKWNGIVNYNSRKMS